MITTINFRNLRILFFLNFVFANLTFAAPPDDTVTGRLVFLGVTNDLSDSVWFSATSAGSFELKAAQGNQLIDAWDESANGLHLSLSPVVSQGNGGVHKLINAANNKTLDQTNQSGGILFPPLPSLPPEVSPPIAVYPEHPIVIPPNPINPPITITPPNLPSTTPGGPTTGNSSTNAQSSSTSLSRENMNAISNRRAPITRARELTKAYNWNIWADNRYYNINDTRFNLDSKGNTLKFAVGADRHITTNLVSGLMASFMKYSVTAFNGGLVNRANGFNVGPYFGYLILPKWSVDGAINYGQLQNNNKIAILNSQYTTQLLSAYLHTTVLFQMNKFELKPQALISFTHFQNPNYQFKGTFRNRSFAVDRKNESFNFDYTQLKLEANYTTQTKLGTVLQPYSEVGINYAFVRPNEGQILTGNLTLATVSPLVEMLTVGLRTLLEKTILIDANVGYYSFGQKGLDVWGVKLLGSYSFG